MGLVKSLLARQPYRWRFIHTDSFLIDGRIEMRHHSHLPEDYIAISYTWSPAIKAWRDRIISEGTANYTELQEECTAATDPEARKLAGILQENEYAFKVWLGSNALSTIHSNDPDLDEAHRFLETVAFMAHSRGQDWFWIDILCINQDDVKEKEFFVPKMGELYQRAAETHVYLLGTSFPSDLTSPAIYSPLWMTRAWTLQEHLLSKAVCFCYTLSGDVTEDLRKYLTYIDPTKPGSRPCEFSEQVLRPDPSRPFKWLKVHTIVSPGLGSIATWASSRHVTSCIVEREFENGLGPFLAAYLCDQILEVTGNWFNTNIKGPAYRNYGIPLYASLCGHVKRAERGSARELARLMAEISRRNSTILVDKIYSMLEILGRTDFPVSYAADPQDVRLSILESMPEDKLAATLATKWGCSTDSGHRDSALPRIYNSSPLPKFEIEELSARACFNRSVGTTIRARVGRFRMWMDGKALIRTLDFQRSIAESEPLATESRKAEIWCLTVVNAVNLTVHPEYEFCPAADIPADDVHAAFLDSATRRSSEGMNAIHRIMQPVMQRLPWWRGNSSSDSSSDSTFDEVRNWRDHETEEVQNALDELSRYDEVVELLEVGQCRHTYWYPQEHPSEPLASSVIVGGGNMLDIRTESGDIEGIAASGLKATPFADRKSSLLALECQPGGAKGEYSNRGTVIVEYAGPLADNFRTTLVI